MATVDDAVSRTARSTGTRQRILSAAEDVVLRDGVGRLTLDATAAEAGLSKGGVLYHFPTRDALVAGMIERLVGDFVHDIEEAAKGASGPGSFTRAYVEATVEPGSLEPDRDNRLGAALIAAIAAEPSLLRPLQLAFDDWQRQLDADGIDPVRATVVRLAVDGLWLSELFGLAPPSAARRRAVSDELRRLVPGP